MALVAALVASVAWWPGTATAATVAPPSGDPFYAPPGGLGKVAPGTVLRARPVTIAAAGTTPAYRATQVLYRTTDQLGHASATVATIVAPLAQVGTPKLLSYQTFYDGVADTCRPSYTLQGGDPSNQDATLESTLVLGYVAQGYTVVTADYEGLDDAFGAGLQSGYATLDAIRAAEHHVGLPGHAPVAMVGYSGGSIATEWASELQPTYAPALHLIGVAEGGIPVDYAHNLAYINGSSDWAGAIPAILIGVSRAYHLDLASYLSPMGAQVVASVEQGCLDPTAYPGLTLQDLLKPRYKDWQAVPAFVKVFNASIMGQTSAPAEPLLMAVGDADGTGDGVMVEQDVQQLAYLYCQRGVSVQLNVYDGADHYEAAGLFEPQALAFLDGVYNGVTEPGTCSTITPGDPLTPLPAPSGK